MFSIKAAGARRAIANLEKLYHRGMLNSFDYSTDFEISVAVGTYILLTFA